MNTPVMNKKEVLRMVEIVRERTNDNRELDKNEKMEYIRQFTMDVNNRLEPLNLKILKLCDEEKGSRDSYFILANTSNRSKDHTQLTLKVLQYFII